VKRVHISSLLSFVLILSLSFEALGSPGATWSSRVKVYTLELEIRVLKENWK
jgi:hypothetical protein